MRRKSLEKVEFVVQTKNSRWNGFRDFTHLNQALLAKQARRVLTNPESLAAKIFKQLYFPSCNFLQAKSGNNPSFVWTSLLCGRDLMAKGIRWRIGNGTRVNVFRDPWLLRPHTFKPITVPNQGSLNIMVSELINESGVWDWSKINGMLWEVDMLEVNRVLVGINFGEDRIIWHYSPNGVYTVWSGYHLASDMDASSSNGLKCGFSSGLRKLWSLKLPNKIKIHLWRLLFNAIPVKVNLLIRGVGSESMCPCCRLFQEDVNHLFWYCHCARKIWRSSTLWPCLAEFPRGGFEDLFQWVADNGNVGDLDLLVLICWSLWSKRNLIAFHGKVIDFEDVLARAYRANDHYKIFEKLPVRIRPPPSPWLVWKTSSPGSFKINVDAAVCNSSDFFSVGIVGRDNCGTVVFAEGRRIILGDFSPKTAEFIAVREGLVRAISLGWENLFVESDAIQIIKELIDPALFSPDNPIADQVRSLQSRVHGVVFQHCNRKANQVAHELARVCFHSGNHLLFPYAIPLCISNAVRMDLQVC